ncbi:OPT family small oligopeptide transporter [Candidozyma duobushaemuli]|uniref:OPT family small oligopeptide transporter n=1 Tax=Candidozyma duobushaemuli TaxID=1231522 RepID=A0A2V1AAP1_9ASCO|nr:OPT family small oligopeptide transporter [[Candida] duobushaemulonis]PVH14735.1 OPT family small oligopeptide transporter [[Candida] duobushaemulonis]
MSTQPQPEQEKVAPVLSNIVSAGSHGEIAAHEVDVDQAQDAAIEDVASSLSAEQKFYILKRLHFEGLETLEKLPIAATFMLEKIASMSVEEALEVLKLYLKEHDEDVNIPTDEYDFIEKLYNLAPDYLANPDFVAKDSTSDLDEKKVNVTTKEKESTSDCETTSTDEEANVFEIHDWNLQIRTEAVMIAYHSPYPEVRSVTNPYDDFHLPVETFRVYFLGIIWTALGAFVNQFFAERQPGISLRASVVQLLLYPSGMLMARVLPHKTLRFWKWSINLNPGPWNYKEQMLATIFFSVSAGTPYVSFNIHVQRLSHYYNNQWADWGYQILLILATNFMGFGFAGIIRKFAVYPVRAMWPTILPTLALNRALLMPEKKSNINGWTLSRYKFFFIFFLASFFYFWFPNYLFEALSYFNWLSWIAPENFTLNLVTGFISGLGMNPLPTFDWNIINWNLALTIPFYSQINQYIGTLLGFFIIIAMYYTNFHWTAYLPINTSTLYNNKGFRYEVEDVVNERSLFVKEKYEEIGPPFYSAANLLVYGAFISLYPFAFIYEVTLNYKPMWHALKHLGGSFKNFRKSTFEGFSDPHTIMMKKYGEVADWVFLLVLVVSIVLAIICVQVYPAETPVWGIFFALGINFVFLIPLTAIYSTTGFQFGLNVLVQIIVGYAIPGNGLALNFIKALGFNINGQAQNYITDQKMGHYVKIPPRALFRCQMLSVFISSFISLAVMNFMIDNVENYCTPESRQKFLCPQSNVFFSASVLWGVIGPRRVFGGLYPILQWCFLLGALLAIPCILFKKYAPKKLTKYFQPSLIIGGMLIYAPYNLSYYTSGVYASIAFMLIIRKRYQAWWEKYNYVLSGALDAGVAFSSIIIFFAVQYDEKDINWWGNTVSYQGIEGGAGQQTLRLLWPSCR